MQRSKVNHYQEGTNSARVKGAKMPVRGVKTLFSKAQPPTQVDFFTPSQPFRTAGRPSRWPLSEIECCSTLNEDFKI
jgi:hypothetical protein